MGVGERHGARNTARIGTDNLSHTHTYTHTHDDSRLQRAGKSMLDVNRVRLKRERALERA